MKLKLKTYLKEGIGELEQRSQLTKEDKARFLEACKGYSNYKDSFVRAKDIKEKLQEIAWLVETAESVTLQETEEWFDNVTVNRHMKQMKESYKVLEKTGKELMQSQQRFESAYNDIGRILENYYDVE